MSEHHVSLSLVGNRVIAVSEPIPEELRAAYERIAELEALVSELDEYFDDRADADCDQDGFIPNEEMKMLTLIREIL